MEALDKDSGCCVCVHVLLEDSCVVPVYNTVRLSAPATHTVAFDCLHNCIVCLHKINVVIVYMIVVIVYMIVVLLFT